MALKMIILIPIIMALTLIILTTAILTGDDFSYKNMYNPISKSSKDDGMVPHFPTSQIRVSRFLAEQKEKPNPREAADHCKNDDDICYELEGKNGTCCNNKCIDLSNDDKNCGACKSKCKKYTDSCCGGKCVDLAYDKGNCGECGKKCKQGKYCIYGMCDYA